MKRLGFILAVIMGCMAFASCEKEEQTPVVEEEVFSTNAIAGNYVGTLTALGYSDDPQRAYVTLTRRSSDVVSFEVSCENFDIAPDPVNLVVTESKGVVRLESESSYSISGSISNGVLNVTFVIGGDTFVFSGKKD